MSVAAATVPQPAATARLKPAPGYRRCLIFVLAAYLIVFGSILAATAFMPFAIDGNESFSVLWHAHNLHSFPFAKSLGLTDESFAYHEAAHPLVHTHQGNWPRVFGAFIYSLGARTIEWQAGVTALTVGLAAIFLCFHFFATISSPLFGAVFTLLLMTDYMAFTQWHLVTYRVWHCFFVFSTLLCVRGLGGRRPRLWAILTVVNAACLFYYELIFVAFVALFAVLYAAVLYRRRPKTLLASWTLLSCGAALALCVLTIQLTGYLGWDGFLTDVRYTFLARNESSGPASGEAREMAAFFDKHNIAFWYNFADSSGLRLVVRLLTSLTRYDLQNHTPYFTAVTLLLFLPWFGYCLITEGRRLGRRIDKIAGNMPALSGLLSLVALAGLIAFGFSLYAQQALGVPTVLAAVLAGLGWIAWISLQPHKWAIWLKRPSPESVRLWAWAVLTAGLPALVSLAAAGSRWLLALCAAAWAALFWILIWRRDVGALLDHARAATAGFPAQVPRLLHSAVSLRIRCGSAVLAQAAELWRGRFLFLTLARIAGPVSSGAGIGLSLFGLRIFIHGVLRRAEQGSPSWDAGFELGLEAGNPAAAGLLEGLRFAVPGLAVEIAGGYRESIGKSRIRRLAGLAFELASTALVLSLPALDLSGPAPDAPAPLSWAFIAAAVLVGCASLRALNRLVAGHWAAGYGLPPGRLFAAAAMTAAAAWLAHLHGGWFDSWFRPLWIEQYARWLPAGINRCLYALVAWTLAWWIVEVPARRGDLPRELRPVFLYTLCGLAAYTVTYYLSPGYVYSGYLSRGLSFTIYLTLATVAVPVYLLWKVVEHFISNSRDRSLTNDLPSRDREGAVVPIAAIALPLLSLGFLLAFWVQIQASWVRLVPPNHYAFLKSLREEPYRGSSFAVDNYAAPVAAMTGNWAYYDPLITTGELELDGEGYTIRRDLRYLWFADRKSNRSYDRPDYFVCMTPQTREAVVAKIAEAAGVRQHRGCTYGELFQTALLGLPHPLRPQIVDWDREGERRDGFASWAIVKLDWDFPPYLKESPERELVAVEANPDAAGYEVTYRDNTGRQDGAAPQPPLVELLSFGDSSECREAGDEPVVLAAFDSGPVRLPAEFEGKVGVRLTPRTALQESLYYSRLLRVDPHSPFHLQPCPESFAWRVPTGVRAWRPSQTEIRLVWRPVLGATTYELEMSRNDEPFASIGKTGKPVPTHLIGNISPGDSYRIRVRACAAKSDCSAYSDAVSSAPPSPLPGWNLVRVQVARPRPAMVRVSWQPLADAQYYRIEMAGPKQRFEIAGEIAAARNSYTVADLSGDLAYRFRVRACDDRNRCSAPSPVLMSEPRVAFPGRRPTGLRARRPAPSRVYLTWDKMDGADHYAIRMSRAGAREFFDAAIVDGTEDSHTLAVAPYDDYRFTVRACAPDDSCSAPSEEAGSRGVRPFDGRIPAFTKAERPLPSMARLAWSPVLGAARYRIEFSADGSRFRTAAEPQSDRNVHTITDLPSDADLRFRIRACTAAGGCSDPSAEISLPVVARLNRPPARILAATLLPDGDVRMLWSKIDGAGYYQIQIASELEDFKAIEVIPAPRRSYTITRLAPDTLYRLRVRGCVDKQSECSAFSDEVSVSTPIGEQVETDEVAQ